MADQSNNGEPSGHSALTGLATREQMQLLDLMNQLRNLGVSGEVDLPQIIVVGAQSSGKSSVLEGISHIPFPRGDTLCTTFATEVTLIRGEEHAIRVKIRPHLSSDVKRSEHLRDFSSECLDINEVANVITAARTHLLEYDDIGDDSFLEDTLCVECSHPQFPPLTLVDLPGLIKVPNENQDEDDVDVVRNLVRGYMKNPKSIILAIVSAQSDMSEHSILGMVRELDPGGHRTLGIITKPDTLSNGSPLERSFLRLATNQNTQWHFDLGWHVVRNRTYEERELTPDDRDRLEEEWFAKSVWENTVNAEHVGVRTLRHRLASLLEKHTRRFLPEVVGSIRELLVKCEQDLVKLGPSRETPRKQRDYLINTSEAFNHLVHLSTEGLYRDPFFTSDDHSGRRVRARVQTLNKSFASVMHTHGHSLGTGRPLAHTPQHIPQAYTAAARLQPEINNRESYLEKISTVLRTSSGRELPGMVNPDVLREIFVLKMAKWKDITQAHLDEVWMATKKALTFMAEHCSTTETSQRILRYVINDSLGRKREKMALKLQELLLPHQKCSPITYDPGFEDSLEDSSDTEDEANDEGDDEEDDDDDDKRTEARVLRYVETYYKVSKILGTLKTVIDPSQAALRNFIDNVAILVIEMCLIDGLDGTFSPSTVSRMTDEEVEQLAGESRPIIDRRTQLLEKRSRLESALTQCLEDGEQSPEESIEQAFSVSDTVISTPTEQNQNDPILRASPSPTYSDRRNKQGSLEKVASHHKSKKTNRKKGDGMPSSGQISNSSGSNTAKKSNFDHSSGSQAQSGLFGQDRGAPPSLSNGFFLGAGGQPKQGGLLSGHGPTQESKHIQQNGLFGAPAAQESRQAQQSTLFGQGPLFGARPSQESTGLQYANSTFGSQSSTTGGLFRPTATGQAEPKAKHGNAFKFG